MKQWLLLFGLSIHKNREDFGLYKQYDFKMFRTCKNTYDDILSSYYKLMTLKMSIYLFLDFMIYCLIISYT